MRTASVVLGVTSSRQWLPSRRKGLATMAPLHRLPSKDQRGVVPSGALLPGAWLTSADDAAQPTQTSATARTLRVRRVTARSPD